MEGLDKVKRVILKHGLKQDNPFVRDVRHSTTGLEIFYGCEDLLLENAGYVWDEMARESTKKRANTRRWRAK
ncbi:hypothetical protein [Streptococcus suis]|uniref:hypothetical protein n=1 Tax=Streptococcus suis TaxID=1307 RepID=UPI00241228B2|nr:hypothetical protein [Streptococcus suis]MDG4501795.1 hypothetical protein [Streptococcus suis]MDG4508103.1 hypothetical protein [Streptococcus suis]MDG4510608.1 hypothetical protein [Streptococcus suis]